MNLSSKAVLFCSLVFPVAHVFSADAYLSYNALETHFYKPDEIKSLQNATTDEMRDFLIGSGLDRWAKFHKKEALSALTATYERHGFGLRLLEYPDRYYLLPEIGGPNERPYFEIYEVIEKPVGGDWSKALTTGTLNLASRFADTTFVSREFVSSGLSLDDTYLRVDDFTNNAFESDLVNHADDLRNVRIVDLRFNGGGRIDYARKLLNQLLDADVYSGFQTRRDAVIRFGDPEAIGDKGNSLKGVNVLVSRHTASAAEWLARNLQISGARVMGERTVGKCVVHSVFPVGSQEYFELAIGEVRPASEKTYSHCQYGIIPDVYLQERALIETDAKALVGRVDQCQSESRSGTFSPECATVGVREPVSLFTVDSAVFAEKSGYEESAVDVDVDTVEKTSNEDVVSESVSKDGDHKTDSQAVEGEVQTTETKVWVEKICVESEWQILLGEYLSRAEADALIKRIDVSHRPLAVSIVKDGRQYHQVVIRSILGELNAKALAERLDGQLGVTSTLKRSERSEAHARHLKAVAPEEAFEFINDPIAGSCLMGKFTEKEADELISHLDELADIKFARPPSR